jgi:hypothetical protein
VKVQPVLGDWAVPRVHTLESLEVRVFAELPLPGRHGSAFHDLDAEPTRVLIAGSLHGDEAREAAVTDVRERFRAGEPLTFVADIVTATEVTHVLIEELRFAEHATAPDQTEYRIVLVESPPPPPPPSLLAGLDASLLDQAAGLIDDVTGALAAIDALAVPDLSDPTTGLRDVLDGTARAIGALEDAAGPLTELFGEG